MSTFCLMFCLEPTNVIIRVPREGGVGLYWHIANISHHHTSISTHYTNISPQKMVPHIENQHRQSTEGEIVKGFMLTYTSLLSVVHFSCSVSNKRPLSIKTEKVLSTKLEH